MSEKVTVEEAQKIAWKHLQMVCGHHNMKLTAGEICNDYGFFLQGWNYATQCYQQMKQNNFKGAKNG